MATLCVDLADEVTVDDYPGQSFATFVHDTVEVRDANLRLFAAVVADRVNVDDAVDPTWWLGIEDVVEVSDVYVPTSTLKHYFKDKIWVREARTYGVQSDLAAGGRVQISDAYQVWRQWDWADGVEVDDGVTVGAIRAPHDFGDKVRVTDAISKGLTAKWADAVEVSDKTSAAASLDFSDAVTVDDTQSLQALLAAFDLADIVRVQDAIVARADRVASLGDVVEVGDAIVYADPAAAAFVMNTETTAASLFKNYEFDSLAQLDDHVVLAGFDGFYLMGGSDDAGVKVDAFVKTGMLDFDTPVNKRIGEVLIAYTSDGTMKLAIETYEPTPYEGAFDMEVRPAKAPRASRVVLPKGLVSRFWRFTLGNKDGANFGITSVFPQVSPTKRRM